MRGKAEAPAGMAGHLSDRAIPPNTHHVSASPRHPGPRILYVYFTQSPSPSLLGHGPSLLGGNLSLLGGPNLPKLAGDVIAITLDRIGPFQSHFVQARSVPRCGILGKGQRALPILGKLRHHPHSAQESFAPDLRAIKLRPSGGFPQFSQSQMFPFCLGREPVRSKFSDLRPPETNLPVTGQKSGACGDFRFCEPFATRRKNAQAPVRQCT